MVEDLTTIQFEAMNAIWGVEVDRPYLPHRDPCNSAYIPIPDPARDPNWLAEDLPPLVEVEAPLKYHEEPVAMITEATVPSAQSEQEETSPQEATSACTCSAIAIRTILLPPGFIVSIDRNNAPTAAPPPQTSEDCLTSDIVPVPDTSADADSNTAVRSPVPSIRTPDRDSGSPSSLPSDSIVTVVEDWAGATPFSPAEHMPMRPATAVENRKLDNVMFDCDGHMAFTSSLNSLSVTHKQLPRRPIVTHVDDFESALLMPVQRRVLPETKATDRASQTNEETAKAETTPDYTHFLEQNHCREQSLEQIRLRKHVAAVGTVYESWGLSLEDAYVDVITGFHRVGSPAKRFCLGINVRKSPFVVTLSSWSAVHTKLSLHINYYCAFCETVRDEQVMKILKDSLWVMYNNGSPLSVIVLDGMERKLAENKYNAALVDPIEMLESLVLAWGAEYKYTKFTA